MRHKLLELICIFLPLQVPALGCVELLNLLRQESVLLEVIRVDILVYAAVFSGDFLHVWRMSVVKVTRGSVRGEHGWATVLTLCPRSRQALATEAGELDLRGDLIVADVA